MLWLCSFPRALLNLTDLFSRCSKISAKTEIESSHLDDMDILISIVGNIIEHTIAPVARQVGYVIFFRRNVKNLKTQVDELQKAKQRVEHEIDEATRDAQKIETDVNDWLKKVDETVEEAKLIYGDEGKGSCLHLLQRHQISRKASKMAQEMTEIQTQAKFDRVGYPATPQALRIAESGKDYKALESRTNIMNEIMETLQDSSIHTIGVWGTGGVGKTTLAKEVRRHAKEKNLFDAVVMTTITYNTNLERVQNEIADSLGLTFNNVKSVEGRADLLKRRIKNERSILIIIDDIWGGFQLEPFGIPLAGEHKGCKLLLTSRNLDVLDSEIGIQKAFNLEVLEEDEARNLFEKMAGDLVRDSDRQAIATKIVTLCAGLPVLIITVAKALRNKELYAWKDALKRLEGFDKQGMHQKVYSAVELSYTNLESEEIQSFFLLIALGGRSHFAKYDLLIYCVGQGMFKDVETLEDARNRLHTFTNHLKEKSLLIEDDKIWVVIHDLVREGAVSLATQDQTAFTTKLFSELKEWPERDRLHKCKQIFINWCYLPPLPEKLECPELQVLELDSKFSYLQMPDSFFDETRNLKVLGIAGIDCTLKLPTSLGFLKKLTSLYLYECKLEDIAIVGELTNLQILSLGRSIIQELPREIGKLHKLKLLDLDSCRNLEVIPQDIVSKLTSLEELYMGNGFVNWDVKVEGKTNASLNELEELKHHLRAIHLSIPNAEVLQAELFFEKLDSFRIFIGDVWIWDEDVHESIYESKTLKLKLSRSIQSKPGFKMMLKRVNDLSLDELNGVKDVLHDLHENGFPLLNHLTVQNNGEIESIAGSSGGPLYAFPNLETLSLYNLSDLESICHGSLTWESFCKLRSVKIQNCEKLVTIFPASIVRNLHDLEILIVSNCNSVEVIFEFQEPSDTISSIGKRIQLEILALGHLPKLKQIWKNTYLQGTFNFKNLKTVYVEDCPMLSYVFPSSLANDLRQVKDLITIQNSPTTDPFEQKD
ncbi:hypothetical protein L6164_000762 [Bauhinia variegata]|uniref:Uncharacterized protein n=1 Tax=Bauhinia variegata TaxID=167791 RepID=A0ACB9Q7G2_BAUVA|nr:hypothetical protein L6164_000762 [Bauhinia variegata]